MSTPRRRRLAVLSRLAGVAVAIVLFWGSFSAAVAMPRGERHEVRHEIEQFEDHWRDAMTNADTGALNAMLSRDYIGITANGTLQTRDDLLLSLRNGSLHFRSIEVSDRKIRFYGSTALVTSRAEVAGTGPSGDLSGSYRYTHVYARSAAGVWQVVSFEASRIHEDDRR